MSAAKVASDGKVTLLDRKAESADVVTEQDVQDTAKLARLLGRTIATVTELVRRYNPRRVDFEDVPTGAAGTITSLIHRFGGRVRWSVVGWQTNATPLTENQFCYATTWIQRALWGGLTLASNAGNFTVGVRFRATSACLVTGARFLWKASTRTVKVTLWRDSDGAILGSGTVACTDSGCYAVTFTTPVYLTGADLNADLTLGVYDLAGAVFTNTGADAVWRTYHPITFPGFSLRTSQLFLAGDNRPTTTLGGGDNWVEPILTPAEPHLIESSASDANTLALTSWAPGTATIRVEEAG